MATGYTSVVKDGISFSQFALRCAHAVGEPVELRDSGLGSPIPEFKPCDYHQKELEKAKERLACLRKMDATAADVSAEAEWVRLSADHIRCVTAKRDLRAKYEAMLKQVEAWVPPTYDHQGLKRFMTEQLTSSIDSDCSERYDAEFAPKHLTGPAVLARELATAQKNIYYHTAEYAKEVACCAERNEWVRALRESLPQEENHVSRRKARNDGQCAGSHRKTYAVGIRQQGQS